MWLCVFHFQRPNSSPKCMLAPQKKNSNSKKHITPTLAGYLELETNMSIRKADTWASLIFGLPFTMLVHKKLHE